MLHCKGEGNQPPGGDALVCTTQAVSLRPPSKRCDDRVAFNCQDWQIQGAPRPCMVHNLSSDIAAAKTTVLDFAKSREAH